MTLKRRPRCKDGSLDMRYKVNWGLRKYDIIGDFYDPENPREPIMLVLNSQEPIDSRLRCHPQD